MKEKHFKRIAAFIIASGIMLNPLDAHAMLLKQGSRGDDVKQIQVELKEMGYFTYHTATGYYGPITAAAVKKFQQAKGLQVDGIVGPQTTTALFDNQVTNVNSNTITDSEKVGALDWWTEVQYIFPRGAVATVTDLDTGKSFQLKRTFGTNHADVEPLTKDDSNVIKEVWGGWSWTRRAVIVSIGEYKIAGSMTAMPHAGLDSEPAVVVVDNRSYGYGRGQNLDAVKNNGVDGHMDIHFLNSRTHSTNKMQKSHQDQIKRAAEYLN